MAIGNNMHTQIVLVLGLLSYGVLQAAEQISLQEPRTRSIHIYTRSDYAPFFKISISSSNTSADPLLWQGQIQRMVGNFLSLPISVYPLRISIYDKSESDQIYLGTVYIRPEERSRLVSIEYINGPFGYRGDLIHAMRLALVDGNDILKQVKDLKR